MLDSPMLLWSRKLCASVLKVSASSSQPLEGNLHAELVLLVALAVEGDEGGVVGVGEGEDRAGGGDERRGLVEASIEGAEDPVEVGNAQGRAEAGVGVVLGKLALKSGLAETGDEREP